MENVKRICTPSLHLHSTNVKIWPCRRAAALQLCCLDIYQPWKIAQSQDPNSLQSMWATEKYCSSTIRVSLSLYIFLLSIYIYRELICLAKLYAGPLACSKLLLFATGSAATSTTWCFQWFLDKGKSYVQEAQVINQSFSIHPRKI